MPTTLATAPTPLLLTQERRRLLREAAEQAAQMPGWFPAGDLPARWSVADRLLVELADPATILALLDALPPQVDLHDGTWLPVPGYEQKYYVSEAGQVYGTYRDGGLLSPYLSDYGYLLVGITDPTGKQRNVSVHRLVALAFLPNPEGKPQVNHRNGVKTDNHRQNLEWATNSENVQHAYDTGLASQAGERNPQAKLTEAQVVEIRQLLANGALGKDVASRYGVSDTVISRIKSGQAWPEASQAANGRVAPPPPGQPVAQASSKQLDYIRTQLQDPRITASERERVEAKLATFNKREASTCIDTLGAWIKDRGLTTPAPAPVPQGPIYHLFYMRQHSKDRHLRVLCRRTYPAALSFAHAYELLLADLKQHQQLAAAKGFPERVSLLAVNGVRLEDGEREGHLEEATLEAVQELADSLDPPRVPEGSSDNPDPFMPA